MMATRVFAEKRGYRLVSDERDIMLPFSLNNDVISWCDQMGISAEPVNHSPIKQTVLGVTLWRVADDRDRVLFSLRWS